MAKLKNRKAFDPIYSFIFNTIWIIVFIGGVFLLTLDNLIISIIAGLFLGAWFFFGISSFCLELEKRDNEIIKE